MPVWAGLALRAQGGSSVTPSSNGDDHGTVAPVASHGDFPANLHGLRRCFPGRWASFLHAHFLNAAHVAAFFDVDDRTARAWLSGKHGVNSAPVILAMQRIPGAVAELLEAA